jgi:hypothetical protein
VVKEEPLLEDDLHISDHFTESILSNEHEQLTSTAKRATRAASAKASTKIAASTKAAEAAVAEQTTTKQAAAIQAAAAAAAKATPKRAKALKPIKREASELPSASMSALPLTSTTEKTMTRAAVAKAKAIAAEGKARLELH